MKGLRDKGKTKSPQPKEWGLSWGDIDLLVNGLVPDSQLKILQQRFLIDEETARLWLDGLSEYLRAREKAS